MLDIRFSSRFKKSYKNLNSIEKNQFGNKLKRNKHIGEALNRASPCVLKWIIYLKSYEIKNWDKKK